SPYKTQDFLTGSVVTVTGDEKAMTVYKLMIDRSLNHIPVIEDDKVVGILSDRDVKFCSKNNKLSNDILVSEIMTKNPYCVKADTPLHEIVLTMSQRKINSAVIVGDSQDVIGIFTSSDALYILAMMLPQLSKP
ncbi:CBS domain-containing protein, partial [Bacteriovoracaceae bacterium]|nr:CBS domain-containing protein [Bacteriovoracaceae bacterium]